MLELINRARADPAAEASRDGIDLNEGLAAGTISTAAKQPLAFNPDLIDSALGHSQWMIANQLFQHDGPGTTDPGERMTDVGYDFTGSYGWERILPRKVPPARSIPPPPPMMRKTISSSTAPSPDAATGSTSKTRITRRSASALPPARSRATTPSSAHRISPTPAQQASSRAWHSTSR